MIYRIDRNIYILIFKLRARYGDSVMNVLQKDLARCVTRYQEARKNLNKCIKNAWDRGLTREEILAVAESYQSGMPFCSIIVLHEILNYEKNVRQSPIDIVKERKGERGDV